MAFAGYRGLENKEILQKAIEKAVDNGFVFYTISEAGGIVDHFQNLGGRLSRRRYYEVIFSHSFAKAFFGEGEVTVELEKMQEYWQDAYLEDKWVYFQGALWQFHLQQMVLEPQPLKYLERFLDA